MIGKDILTTHAVYWPTMLMSAGIELPKTIFAHGWWLMGESKMSKSVGNVINPMDLIDDYGVDPVRYYLMREMVLGQDSSFTMDSFIQRYNSDLANDFGNLLSRVSTLMKKNYDGKIPEPGDFTETEAVIKSNGESLGEVVKEKIEAMRLNEAIEEIILAVIHENPAQVEAYLAGKEKLFGFFVGQVMKLTEGKANPKTVNNILKDKLK